MPLLDSSVLSNWYKLILPNSTRPILAESFTQSKVQDASNKGMIQGDIGVRVMDVGTLYYTSSLSGPNQRQHFLLIYQHHHEWLV